MPFVKGEPRSGGTFRHVCPHCGKQHEGRRPNWSCGCLIRAELVAGKRDVLKFRCIHLGEKSGRDFTCDGCSKGSPRVHALFECAQHGECLPLANVAGAKCCRTCGDYSLG